MIDWIIAGALNAVLMAEVVSAWALRRLAQRCVGMRPRSQDEQRLVRWYAEGFDHTMALSSWLRGGSLVLTLLAVACGAHPLVIVASLILAIAAHGERCFSARLRRRFLTLNPRAARASR